MQKPISYTAQIAEKTQVTPKVAKLTINLTNPSTMDFDAGKFVNLKCPNGKFRAYSLASDPKLAQQNGQITLFIENGHDGVASNYVNSLKIGDQIQLIGPSGKFILSSTLPENLVFFATGTGIAPFYSMFYKLSEMQYKGKIQVYFGVRTEDLIIEENLLKEFAQKLSNFSYDIYLSQSYSSKYKNGRITKVFETSLNLSAQYYICGSPAMVKEIIEKLNMLGVESKNIISEGFTHAAHP